MLKTNRLIQFAGIPVSGSEVKSVFSHLAASEKKVQALERSGELIRLRRSLFVVNSQLTGRDTDPRLCANHIYGPSYVSLQWALSFYGMIPEGVRRITSVTTKRSRVFDTPMGIFSYMQVPTAYFPIGVESVASGGVNFLMATREKALCDTIQYDSFVPPQSIKALAVYLEEDMRMDMDILSELDPQIIEECAHAGRKTRILLNLVKLIKQ